MTAKEQLRQVIEELSEPQARAALTFIVERREDDPVLNLFERAPEDDEPRTPEEDAGADEARAEYERGDSIPLAQLRRELR